MRMWESLKTLLERVPPLIFGKAESTPQLCGVFARTTAGPAGGASRCSWVRKLQVIPREDVVQQRFVDFGLFEQLLDSGQVFVPPDARGNRDEVLRAENLRWNAFVLDRASFPDRFFGQSGGREELNRKAFYEQVLAIDEPAALAKVRVDFRNPRAESVLSGDKDDVRIVGGEWLDVVDGGERAAERVVLDEACGDEIIRCAEDIGEGYG